MRKIIWIFFCSCLLGTALADNFLPETEAARTQARQTAWWSVMYERPNPERLPVRVRFRWLPISAAELER